MLKTLEEIAREMLAYEREAFERDECLDLADLCSAVGVWRYEIKRALSLPLTGSELLYDADFTLRFRGACVAGYDVEPNGMGPGFIARDPDGDEIAEEPAATELGAWEACEAHRLARIAPPVPKDDGPTAA